VREALSDGSAADGLADLVDTAWQMECNSRLGFRMGSSYRPHSPPVAMDLVLSLGPPRSAPPAGFAPVLVVIPFRDRTDTADRFRNLLACLASLRDQSCDRHLYHVVVVETDATPRRRTLIEPRADSYLFALNPGPFNKSWAVNAAVVNVAVDHEVVCVLDADVLADRDFILRNVERFRHPGTMGHLTYRDMYYLDGPATSAAIGQRLVERRPDVDLAILRGFLLRRPPGCCVWVRTSAFHRVGGMDERFEGWGGEDNDFAYRLGINTAFDAYHDTLLHMYHPSSASLRDDGELTNAHIPALSWPADAAIGRLDRWLQPSTTGRDDMSTSDPIPTFDIAEWRTADTVRRSEIAAMLDRALRKTGMLLLRGHGTPRALTERMRSIGRSFFDLPEEVKQSYRVTRPYDNGWRGIGGLQVGALDGAPGTPDLHEAFHMGPDHRTGDTEFDRTYYPDNKWPAELPSLQSTATEYTGHMERVSLELLEVFADILDLDADFFASKATRPTWTQNVNWYPSLGYVGAVDPGQMRVGPHSDFGTLSLLDRQPGVGGLEVWNEDGWFKPAYDPDTIAVIVGDLMHRWTDGRWAALRHRVLAPSAEAADEELVSLVFFFEADPTARIEPLAAPIGGGRGMDAVVAGEEILNKVGLSLNLEQPKDVATS